MEGRNSLRVPLLASVAMALVGAVLFVAAPPSDAASMPATGICRSIQTYSERMNGVLIPAAMPAHDPAIVIGDPDAEIAPMASVRFPDETGLWASAGVRGEELVTVMAEADAPIDRSAGVLADVGPERHDRAVSDSIVRLYCGLLGRHPDATDVEYWARRYWNGLPLVSIAEAFTTSGEFIERHGDPTDEALVTILYRSVLGREPGVGGVEPFLEMLRSGELTKGSLVVAFTESPEFVATTGTVSPEKPQLPYPAVGSGRRIIYANGEARVWFVAATGELVKTHQVSGRRGVPTPDRYRVYSKSRHAFAPHDNVTMEYMVRFAKQEWPYGFHSIPIHEDRSPFQTKEQLGTLRSGGCVRQDFDDAKWTFDWARIGDRVIMLP
ncbi:MAG TPA: DUF4214 domain-containing protein [Acidimicrobiia bacterium]|nr:DUF4214 domain-containing protein [Acidimicrobiia bacterium]